MDWFQEEKAWSEEDKRSSSPQWNPMEGADGIGETPRDLRKPKNTWKTHSVQFEARSRERLAISPNTFAWSSSPHHTACCLHWESGMHEHTGRAQPEGALNSRECHESCWNRSRNAVVLVELCWTPRIIFLPQLRCNNPNFIVSIAQWTLQSGHCCLEEFSQSSKISDQILRFFAELVDLLRLAHVLIGWFFMFVVTKLFGQPLDFVLTCFSTCRKWSAKNSEVKSVVPGFSAWVPWWFLLLGDLADRDATSFLDVWSRKTAFVEPSTDFLQRQRCATRRNRCLERPVRESTDAIQLSRWYARKTTEYCTTGQPGRSTSTSPQELREFKIRSIGFLRQNAGGGTQLPLSTKTGWRFHQGSRRETCKQLRHRRQWVQTHWKTSNWNSQHSSNLDDWWFSSVRTGFGCLTGGVNSRPNKYSTCRVAQHDHIHHANTRGLKSCKAQDCTFVRLKKKKLSIHVSMSHSLPAFDTGHKAQFLLLTHFSSFPPFSDGFSFENKPYALRSDQHKSHLSQCGDTALAQGESEFVSHIRLHSFPSRLTCCCWTFRLSSPRCPTSRTSATSTSFCGRRRNTPVLPLTGVECLAALPIRRQTQKTWENEDTENRTRQKKKCTSQHCSCFALVSAICGRGSVKNWLGQGFRNWGF